MTYNDMIDNAVNETIDEVATYTPEQAEAFALGATSVIGVFSLMGSQFTYGEDGTTYSAEADLLIGDLFEATNPFLLRLREAAMGAADVTEDDLSNAALAADLMAQIAGLADVLGISLEEDDKAEVEVEVPDFSETDDVIEGIFANIFGAEEAARIRAEVEAEDRRRALANAA